MGGIITMQTLNTFSSRAELDQQLAKSVSTILAQAISKNGKASIAVSGGSTPKGFFLALSQYDIEWSNVTITLADERWVEASDSASNTTLVKENLLINKASKANFFEIKLPGSLNEEAILLLNERVESLLPLDVLILGMGEDGHTASLFPCSDEIDAALDESNPNSFIKVVPKTAPHDRISFTYKALLESKNVILHLCGESKKQVLDEANSDKGVKHMPIRGFLHHPTVDTQIYWAG